VSIVAVGPALCVRGRDMFTLLMCSTGFMILRGFAAHSLHVAGPGTTGVRPRCVHSHTLFKSVQMYTACPTARKSLVQPSVIAPSAALVTRMIRWNETDAEHTGNDVCPRSRVAVDRAVVTIVRS
jgi:hypothetical protein